MHGCARNAGRVTAAPHIDDPTNAHVVHPLSRALLPLAICARIHPNAVSVVGLGFAGLSGTAYYHWHDWRAVLLGFALMVAWHVCDGLDGTLARATGKASAFGRVVDGTCDYLAFFAVLIPIAVGFPDWGDKLALCLTAGAAHAVQAMWYEGEREAWTRRAAGVFAERPRPATGTWYDGGYNRVERVLGSRARPIDDALTANPGRLPAYLAATAPLVRGLLPLSANGRTLAIPLFCLVGHAEWFWYWELVGLSLFAGAMALRLRTAERRIVADAPPMLDPTPAPRPR